jgi:hypothetical protein
VNNLAAPTPKVITMGSQAKPHGSHDDDMPAEIDFSKGTRGKFHRPGTKPHLPVYLDDHVQDALSKLAQAKGIELSTLVNQLLRKGHRAYRDRALRLAATPMTKGRIAVPSCFALAGNPYDSLASSNFTSLPTISLWSASPRFEMIP